MGLETIAAATIVSGIVNYAGARSSANAAAGAGRAAQALNEYNAGITEQTADYNADLTLSTAEANAAATTTAATYNADQIVKAADYNASISDNNAKLTLRDANAMATAQRFNNARILASQRAKFGASGAVVGVGSPLVIEASQAGLLEMRALATEREGQNRANEFAQAGAMERWQAGEAAKLGLFQAEQQNTMNRWQAWESAKMTRWTGRQQANLDRMSGTAARRAGDLNARATVLQGVGNLIGSGVTAYGRYKGVK